MTSGERQIHILRCKVKILQGQHQQNTLISKVVIKENVIINKGLNQRIING